jgi:hypothetical protein
MPLPHRYLVGVVVFVILSVGRGHGAPEGFRALFNGNDLSGWWGAQTEDPRGWKALSAEALEAKKAESRVEITRHWRVENSELVNPGTGPYLTTNEDFGDYELLLEYRTVAGADSGIYLKGSPQVQIWDTTEAGGKWDIGAGKGSGGLWNNSPGQPGQEPWALADRPFGEWNQFRIIQCGSRTWVWLNDVAVVQGAILENYFDKSRTLPIPAQGPLQLQTHGGEIRWRNIFLREIGVAEANQRLRERADEGFAAIFNGRDFKGWDGALEGYQIEDGALLSRPDKGGVIHTDQDYENFSVRFEYRLPAGGNSGLAIRYPGSGDTAYVGMAEVQVLDDSAERYAELDERQYNGSAYGMVAAERGYLREVGEWNFEEVTVDGSTIKVELNGTVILDTDLSVITKLMQDRPHPGKDRTTGAFGFAGHRSPVAFRHISLKTLP